MAEAIERIFFSRKILTVALSVLTNGCMAQGSDGALKALRAYEQGNWKQASTLYESIEQKDSVTWYNLGNSYYQQERCADALVCWRRAQRGATLNELTDIEFNSACLFKKMGSCTQHISWSARLHCVMPSPWIMQLFFLLFWYAACALIMFRKRIASRYFLTLCGGSMLMSGLLGILLVIQYRDCHMNTGIIVPAAVNVCAGPHEQYHVLGTVQELDEVIVYAQRPGWYKIGTQTVHGWIPARTVRIV